MKFIIELDGPVLDVRERYMKAYRDTVARFQKEPLPAREAWRLIRDGAPDGRLLRGARPDELREFREAFEEALESDEAFETNDRQVTVGEALRELGGAGELILVTTGSNRLARQMLLDRFDLSIHFTRMKSLTGDLRQRSQNLRELADGDPRVLVAGTSEPVIRAVQPAGLVAVAISNGACSETRLVRSGAQVSYPALDGLARSVARGGEDLLRAGLLPPQRPTNHNPFVEPDHGSRFRDRHSSSAFRGRR